MAQNPLPGTKEYLRRLFFCLLAFSCFWTVLFVPRIGKHDLRLQALDTALDMPTRPKPKQKQDLVQDSINKLIQQNKFKSLDVLFNAFKHSVPTDTHLYGEEIQNTTQEELRCKRYGLEYNGRKTRRRIFFGSLVADDSWHAMLAHAAEAHALYHSVSLVESNVTTSGEEGHVRSLRFPPGSFNLEVLQSGIFGPNTTVTVDMHIDRPEARMDYEVWGAVEFSQRDLISDRWKQNGMRHDDIGIISDLDEVFTRDFLLAAQSCDVPEFRPNQDCHKPRIMGWTLIFESSAECITAKRRWFHPDMILGECIDKIGDPTIHRPGKRAWGGEGPRLEGYGNSPDSYENMPNVSMYPLWKPDEIRHILGDRWLDSQGDFHYAYHFHNFFDSIAVMRNKYVTYSHNDPEAASIPLGEIHQDVNLTVNCVTERADRQNKLHRLEGGFTSIVGPKPILFQLSESYRKERQKELRDMILKDEEEFGISGADEEELGTTE